MKFGVSLPKRVLWTERVIELFPIGKERGKVSFVVVRVVRSLCFFSIFWLTGFLAIAIDGVTSDSLSLFMLQMPFFCIIGFIVFVGSGWFRNQWNWFFNWTRHILKLSEPEFGRFRDKLERFINNFFPCLAIALILFFLNLMPQLDLLYVNLFLHPLVLAYWWCGMVFMLVLFMATMFWMIISLWIGTFLTFRQPLNLTLSRRTSRKFRPLALWSLKVSLLYFMGLAIIVVYESIQRFLWGTILYVAIVGFLILIGVLAFLLPFYNIHRALVNLKKRKLREIEEESNKLIQESNDTLAKYPAGDSRDRIMLITSRLVSLHAKERNLREADEWPIDPTILVGFTGFVLIPILTNIIVTLLFLIS